ncbi:hypothetical protein [Pseudomonas sp. TE3610]
MTELTVRIAELTPALDAPPRSTTRFTHVSALLQQPPFDVLILNASPAENLAWLHTLRRHPAYQLALIYCRDTEPMALALSDGPPPTNPQQAWQQWQARLAVFNPRPRARRATSAGAGLSLAKGARPAESRARPALAQPLQLPAGGSPGR